MTHQEYKGNYPILEFDPAPDAIIDPSRLIDRQEKTKHAVICFFAEVIQKVVSENNAKVLYTSHSEMGEHPIYEMNHKGHSIAFFHPGIGAPLAVGLTEEVIALGIDKLIACGGCGVLDKQIGVGHLLLPECALRDEGTSYHYSAPSREICLEPEILLKMEAVLLAHQLPYRKVKTWTTDAFYRETEKRVEAYLSEGCSTVEMETAALFALAQFRKVKFGQYLYGGDAVLAEGWDGREWNSRKHIREHLFWLSVETCLTL